MSVNAGIAALGVGPGRRRMLIINVMSPSDQKSLFGLVESAIERGKDDLNPEPASDVVARLRDLGFVKRESDSLSRDAFLEYFQSFEVLTPPSEV